MTTNTRVDVALSGTRVLRVHLHDRVVSLSTGTRVERAATAAVATTGVICVPLAAVPVVLRSRVRKQT